MIGTLPRMSITEKRISETERISLKLNTRPYNFNAKLIGKLAKNESFLTKLRKNNSFTNV